jgi:ubiquinol-cytochrome c reductase iron-sulfur subunit
MNKLLLSLLLVCLTGAAARADDYPRGLVREQIEQAGRGLELDLAALKPGEVRSLEYVGRPVYVYRRTKADLEYLKKTNAALTDPSGSHMKEALAAAYQSSASEVWARLLFVDQPALEKRRSRSRLQDYLVVAAWGPQSGCRLDIVRDSRRDDGVLFADACLGAWFDSAGRVFKGEVGNPAAKLTPAPYNLYIPPHRIAGKKLVVGIRHDAALPELGRLQERLYREADPTHNLIIAARYNDAAMVETALGKGAEINAFRPEDGSPLDAAILGSPIETVRLLIERGARPTPRSRRSAEFVGRAEVIELLDKMASPSRSR